jgi:hypothetical protein
MNKRIKKKQGKGIFDVKIKSWFTSEQVGKKVKNAIDKINRKKKRNKK